MIDLHDGRLMIGYHGTTESIAEDVLSLKSKLSKSNNDYDWLGSGIYFWEYNFERSWEWAEQATKANNKKTGRQDRPYVLGAIINLGRCLDLVSSDGLGHLVKAHENLKLIYAKSGDELPQNTEQGGKFSWKRQLDCLVINHFKSLLKENNVAPIDSVRGVFWEGKPLYEHSGFRTQNHIQLAVEEKCIKGYFRPEEMRLKKEFKWN